jgi:hypothetical protein
MIFGEGREGVSSTTKHSTLQTSSQFLSNLKEQ